jgi:hypothetical protein
LCGVGSAASSADGLTINVTYGSNSLQATLSNGTTLSSGAVVPPGPYSVVVYDSGVDANPSFTVNGPGASVSSDLNPTGTQIEVPMTFGPFVLQPSSSYSISDPTIGGGATITFTTSATGSSISPNTTTTTSSTGTTSSGSSTGASSSTLGSGVVKTLGAMALTVPANGKPILTLSGKPVKTVKAGMYSLVVGDASKRAGAFLGVGERLITLSGVTAIGTSLRTITLTRGHWFFEASTKGPRYSFTVT